MRRWFYLILFLLISLISIKLNFGDRQFHKKAWAEFPQKRYRMTEDLIRSKILIGKTKEEVVKLLTNDSKQFKMQSNNWMYYTKVKPGWRNANIEILDIAFKSGIVINAKIRE